VIVLSPKDAGKKSTRMSRVLRALKQKGEIAGGYRIPLRIVMEGEGSVMNSLCHSVSAPSNIQFWDLLSITTKRVVLVMDDIDSFIADEEFLTEEGKKRFLKRTRDLDHDLSMSSVTPGRGVIFQVFVLAHNPEIAKMLLTINGGKKVRLIGYGKQIKGVDERYDVDTWQRRGMKLQVEDVKKLVNDFNERNKLSLDDETRDKLVTLGIKSGAPGFIRGVYVVNSRICVTK